MVIPQKGIDPRLIALVVTGVTAAFLLVAIVATIRDADIASGWFLLMGTVAGGVLGYGALRRP